MKRLFVSDLDGTLLDEKKGLEDEVAKKINYLINEKGLNFTIATGRCFEDAKPVLDKINFKLPVILQNGALIVWPQTKEIFSYKNIDNNIKEKILKFMDENDLNARIVDKNDNKFFVKTNKPIERFSKKYKKIIKRKKYIDITEDVTMINSVDFKENLLGLNEIIKNDNISLNMCKGLYSEEEYYWLIITNPKANKGNAVMELKEKFNFDEILAFGDGENDIPMSKKADVFIVSKTKNIFDGLGFDEVANNKELVKYIEKSMI